MLMKDKKKDIASIIVAKMNGNGPEVSGPAKMEDNAEQDTDIAIDTAAKEIMDAIEKKDVSMLKIALRSFVDMCSYDQPEMEEESEEME